MYLKSPHSRIRPGHPTFTQRYWQMVFNLIAVPRQGTHRPNQLPCPPNPRHSVLTNVKETRLICNQVQHHESELGITGGLNNSFNSVRPLCNFWLGWFPPSEDLNVFCLDITFVNLRRLCFKISSCLDYVEVVDPSLFIQLSIMIAAGDRTRQGRGELYTTWIPPLNYCKTFPTTNK